MNLCYVCHQSAITGKNLCAACLQGAYNLRGVPVPEQVKIDARKCRALPQDGKFIFDPKARLKHPKELGRVRSSWSKVNNMTY